MELKSNWHRANSISTDVLIVPLWNWNRCRPHAEAEATAGSNCTFMELKCRTAIHHQIRVQSSNCTFMELKLDELLEPLSPTASSNCTFMELKSQQTGSQTCDTKF